MNRMLTIAALRQSSITIARAAIPQQCLNGDYQLSSVCPQFTDSLLSHFFEHSFTF
jgi:hypothetical protein